MQRSSKPQVDAAALMKQTKERFAPEMARLARNALETLQTMIELEEQMAEQFIQNGGRKFDARGANFSEERFLTCVRTGIESIAEKTEAVVANAV